jgi:hypothetical protein
MTGSISLLSPLRLVVGEPSSGTGKPSHNLTRATRIICCTGISAGQFQMLTHVFQRMVNKVMPAQVIKAIPILEHIRPFGKHPVYSVSPVEAHVLLRE